MLKKGVSGIIISMTLLCSVVFSACCAPTTYEDVNIFINRGWINDSALSSSIQPAGKFIDRFMPQYEDLSDYDYDELKFYLYDESVWLGISSSALDIYAGESMEEMLLYFNSLYDFSDAEENPDYYTADIGDFYCRVVSSANSDYNKYYGMLCVNYKENIIRCYYCYDIETDLEVPLSKNTRYITKYCNFEW